MLSPIRASSPTASCWSGPKIGPFRITPWLVDHSAFDAYSLLVEADGKRVFYSGDFRAHGRKATLFEAMIARPPKDIDILLMEGTTIGREGAGERFPTEADLEAKFAEAFRATRGIHFVWTSSQNIDRLVTVFRAAKRSGRVLIVDLYTAVVLEATGRDSIPQAGWPEVRLYIPQRHAYQGQGSCSTIWRGTRRTASFRSSFPASRIAPSCCCGPS